MILSKHDIENHLRELNDELAHTETKGEICLYGGAVMCLAFDARPSTKDVDAVFKPSSEIRAAARIAARHGLRSDWLNAAVKGYVVNHKQNLYVQFSHLSVYLPDAHYLLAMKTLAARVLIRRTRTTSCCWLINSTLHLPMKSLRLSNLTIRTIASNPQHSFLSKKSSAHNDNDDC